MAEPTEPERPGRFMRVMQRAMPRITPWHVRLYRLLGGRLVGQASGGAPLLLLTTTGRRTGKPRTVALGHLREDDAFVIAGTNGGLPDLPAWVFNLRSEPRCRVEFRSERFEAEAEFLQGPEHDRFWSRLVDEYPIYEQARRYAGRAVPLVMLRRTATGVAE